MCKTPNSIPSMMKEGGRRRGRERERKGKGRGIKRKRNQQAKFPPEEPGKTRGKNKPKASRRKKNK
jgi:hypothetical protein